MPNLEGCSNKKIIKEKAPKAIRGLWNKANLEVMFKIATKEHGFLTTKGGNLNDDSTYPREQAS